MELEDIEKRLGSLIVGRRLVLVSLHGSQEIVLKFDDGTRLFVSSEKMLDISVT